MKHLSFILFCTLLLGVGCQKKCQQPSEPAKTITEKPWRLVETTNPGVKNNDRFTFIILQFERDFSGAVKRVVNNREFDKPVRVLKYNLATDNGRSGNIIIEFKNPPAEGEGETPATGADEGTEVSEYEYSLGRDLTMTELKTGYTYYYVPYEGIIDPDENCTF